MASPGLVAERLDARALAALPEAAGLARKRLGAEIFMAATPASPTVVLGYQQSLRELDLESCRAAGVEVGRRFTAGDAFLLGNGDIEFAIATAKGERWSHREAVTAALECVAEAARSGGVEPKVSRSVVLADQRRFAGADAMRKWGAHLACGYAMLSGPLEPFAAPLMLTRKELAANYGPLERDRAKGDPREFAAALAEAWARKLGVPSDSFPAASEVKEIEALATSKYAGERWLTVR